MPLVPHDDGDDALDTVVLATAAVFYIRIHFEGMAVIGFWDNWNGASLELVLSSNSYTHIYLFVRSHDVLLVAAKHSILLCKCVERRKT